MSVFHRPSSLQPFRRHSYHISTFSQSFVTRNSEVISTREYSVDCRQLEFEFSVLFFPSRVFLQIITVQSRRTCQEPQFPLSSSPTRASASAPNGHAISRVGKG